MPDDNEENPKHALISIKSEEFLCANEGEKRLHLWHKRRIAGSTLAGKQDVARLLQCQSSVMIWL